MSLTLFLDEYSINLTYNYSAMWALALGQAGKQHDPPRSFFEPEPPARVRLIEIEGLTGRQSLEILHPAVEAMIADMPAYRALNPENGWGDADSLLLRLQECIAAAQSYPDLVWEASR